MGPPSSQQNNKIETVKLKLDLHTHCLEAVNFAHPEPKTVKRILEAIKAQGLDGIAITDHAELGDGFAYAVREVIKQHFPGETLVIPGQELRRGIHHIVELNLPGGLIFRYLAHPGTDISTLNGYLKNIHGLEVENGNQTINRAEVSAFAQHHGLLLLSNSDAHSLSDIGRHYTETSLDELCTRAR